MQQLVYLLLILFFVQSTPVYANDSSRLVSYTLWKTVSKAELSQKMRANKIPKAMLNPKYDVNIYDVKYLSRWHDGSEVLCSGLYFVPQAATDALPQLVYHHGTQMIKGRDEDIKRETNLALGYAVDGYVVLMPDYFGLGHGDRFHLYQLYEPLAQTSVDFLLAAQSLHQPLGINVNKQLFLTGYSEGGYAALGTNKVIQEKYSHLFTVTATAANAGAYDLAGAQSKAMFQPYPRPQFLPYLLMGVNEIYKMVPNVNTMYRAPYDTLIPRLFDWTNTLDDITSFFPAVAKDILLDTFVQLYFTDTNFVLKKALKQNTIYDWKPENPVQLCHCKGDEIVYFENSSLTHKTMRALGAKDVTLRNPGKKYSHRSCGLFATMYSKLYLDSFRRGSVHGRKGDVGKRFLLSLAKLKKPLAP